MGLSVEKLGARSEPTTFTVDPERVLAYARATNDDNPAYEAGKYAPPVFAVVPTWEAVMGVNLMVIPPEVMLMVVHGEQDIHYHRPLVPGMTLTSVGEAYSMRVGRTGTRAIARILSEDRDGNSVLEVYTTAFIRGMSDGESAGPDKPDHSFPHEVRSRQVAEFSVHVDPDQTYRYAEASGDHNPIHLDEGVAKSVGLPGIIVHGLCTMAMCSQAVVKTVAGGDPGRIRRLAVRFSKPVLPGSDVVTTIYDIGPIDGRTSYAFEARSQGSVVIKDGRAEVEA